MSDEATSELPELLMTERVRTILEHYSARTVSRWIQEGYLNPVRMGQTNYFHLDKVSVLIRERLRRRGTGSARDRLHDKFSRQSRFKCKPCLPFAGVTCPRFTLFEKRWQLWQWAHPRCCRRRRPSRDRPLVQ